MTPDNDIQRLEARIEKLEAQEAKLRVQLTKAEIDQWEGRIDDLEVQLHLGALETRDRLAPLVETLRNRWLDAAAQLGDAPGTATDVIDALRTGLERAMKDVRSAVLDAKKVATHS